LRPGCVPCSSSAHRAPGEKAPVPIYKILVRPGQESTSRPTSTEALALTTRPRTGKHHVILTCDTNGQEKQCNSTRSVINT